MSRRRRRMKRKSERHGQARASGRIKLAAGAGLGVGVAMVAPAAAQATDYTVTNLNDGSGPTPPGSLRDAIEQADANPGPDRVLFQSGLSGTIFLTDGQLEVTEAVQVLGPGPDKISICGCPGYRVFYVDAGGDAVTLSGLKMFQGNPSGPNTQGGAVATYYSDTTIADSVLSGNSTFAGAAVYAEGGSLLLRDSTVNNNFAYYASGVFAEDPAQLTIQRSTITGNQGIIGFPVVDDSGQPAAILNSTVANNGGKYGGVLTNGDLTLTNTILADNQTADLFGPAYASFSLIETPVDPTFITSTVPGSNITGVDPKLQGLASNGGATPTMALPPDSPAINQGFSAGTSTDQRGEPRPLNYLGVPFSKAPGADGSDMGAFELQGSWECKGVKATILALPNQVTKGTSGDDVIVGTLGAEKIRAGAGDDMVCAGAGKDIVLGQDGNDDLRGQKGNDGLGAGKGNDVLRGGTGNDTLRAGPGKDVLKGGPGNNKLIPFG
jgi:Ca2+-binding RTX toxin-like protein